MKPPRPQGMESPTGISPDESGFLLPFDAFGESVGLYSLGGRMVRQTRELRRQAENDGIAFLIRAAIAAVAKESGFRSLNAVKTTDGVHVVQAARYDAGGEPMAIVHVSGTSTRMLTDAELVERYGLTRVEVRVARQLAMGAANKEIAVTLGISVHTARHHTEHVLRKLGIRGRGGVARRLHLA